MATRSAAYEPVLTIEGDYALFAHLETVYLGVLTRRTLVSTNVREVVEAAHGKPILFFPARFDHYRVQTGDGYAATSPAPSASRPTRRRAGGAARASAPSPRLIAACNGDTVEATRRFADLYHPDVNVVALVDFDNDCATTSVACADALGERLWGVRLDTSETMVDRALGAGWGRSSRPAWCPSSSGGAPGPGRARPPAREDRRQRVRRRQDRRLRGGRRAGRLLRRRLEPAARQHRLHRRRRDRRRPPLRQGRRRAVDDPRLERVRQGVGKAARRAGKVDAWTRSARRSSSSTCSSASAAGERWRAPGSTASRRASSPTSSASARPGSELVFLVDTHAPDDPEFAMFPPHCVEGSGEDEVVPELRALAAQGHVVRKRHFSGFHETASRRCCAGSRPTSSRWSASAPTSACCTPSPVFATARTASCVRAGHGRDVRRAGHAGRRGRPLRPGAHARHPRRRDRPDPAGAGAPRGRRRGQRPASRPASPPSESRSTKSCAACPSTLVRVDLRRPRPTPPSPRPPPGARTVTSAQVELRLLMVGGGREHVVEEADRRASSSPRACQTIARPRGGARVPRAGGQGVAVRRAASS